ncbi:MAG: GldG family protein, partial [bacterium]
MMKSFRLVLKLLPITGVILLLAGYYFAFERQTFDRLSGSLAVAGVLLFLTIFLKQEVSNLKYYLNVTLASGLTLGILVIIFMIARNHPQEWDLTKNKRFSLSPQTIRLLKNLDKEIRVRAFVDMPDAYAEYLGRYEKFSKNFKAEFLNPNRDYSVVKELGENVFPGNMFVGYYKDAKLVRQKKVSRLEEQDITNAIIEVTRDKDTVVYFLKGHGEKSLEAPQDKRQGATSISRLVGLLKERAMKSKELELAKIGVVPDDASVVVCAGPAADLFDNEVDILSRYLKEGGRAVFLLDPPETLSTEFNNLRRLLSQFGVETEDRVVVDLASQGIYGNPFHPLITNYSKTSPVTQKLAESPVGGMLVPFARPVAAASPAPPGFKVEKLFESSEYSWAITLTEAAKISQTKKLESPDRS